MSTSSSHRWASNCDPKSPRTHNRGWHPRKHWDCISWWQLRSFPSRTSRFRRNPSYLPNAWISTWSRVLRNQLSLHCSPSSSQPHKASLVTSSLDPAKSSLVQSASHPSELALVHAACFTSTHPRPFILVEELGFSLVHPSTSWSEIKKKLRMLTSAK